MQAARNKDACEAKRQSIDQKRENRAPGDEHAQAETGLDELQAQLALMRQKRRGWKLEDADQRARPSAIFSRGDNSTFCSFLPRELQSPAALSLISASVRRRKACPPWKSARTHAEILIDLCEGLIEFVRVI